jgi:mediator of RNA polymerase II transcription subunit 12, fungi type
MWIAHAALLQEILNGNSRPNHNARPTETIYSMLADNFVDIQKRNDAMWFRNLPPRVLARLTEAVSDVTVSMSSLFPVSRSLFPDFVCASETEFCRTYD